MKLTFRTIRANFFDLIQYHLAVWYLVIDIFAWLFLLAAKSPFGETDVNSGRSCRI